MIVATFDAVHGLAQLARHPEARKQIAIADRVVLTKTDLDAASSRPRIADAILDLNPAAAILDVRDTATPHGLLGPAGHRIRSCLWRS